jgi:diguanylate cyclase (GGDEF)-like protein
VDPLRAARDLISALGRARDRDDALRVLRANVADVLGDLEDIALADRRDPGGASSAALERRATVAGDGTLFAPVILRDDVIGVLALRRGSRTWSEPERMLVEIAAGSSAASLSTAVLASGARVAITDTLTGLYDRRFIEPQLALAVAQSERLRKPFAVVALDLDALAALNERLGRDAGDAALVRFSSVVRAKLRGEDLAARLGNDDFIALLPDTDLVGAMRTAERLHAAIAASGDPPLRFSAGVAIWREGRDASAILAAANAALAEVKRAGGGGAKAEPQ